MNNKLLQSKNYFLLLNYSFINYVESNNYYIYSISSIRKFNVPNKYLIFLKNNELIINNSLFFLYNNKNKNFFFILNNKMFEFKLFKYFKECFYENKSKLKIVGRGWKINKYSYQLLIKLGYSHMIYYNLSPLIKYKLKKKKKKYYSFFGVFYNNLTSNLNKISLMRIPDSYTRKGIFYRKILF